MEIDNFKTESVKKLKEMALNIDICMFCTQLDHQPIAARPMSCNDVDDHGNLWFLSDARSQKNLDIKQDDAVQLFFSKIPDSQYLSVYGRASVYTDRQTVSEHWEPIAKAWWDNADDPNITVIKVTPTDAYYWDTKDGKAVAFIKWAANAMGAGLDDGGVQGNINL
ncbi:MAG TPA: pyridoxamine 5'-phosphate oxidase family protein [Flavobacterium sp.]|nr:pyridoxamine 5'-phosphate oxidase family protein [Flavobacterium sp.]